MLHGGTSCDVECRCLISRPLRMFPASFIYLWILLTLYTIDVWVVLRSSACVHGLDMSGCL